MVKIGDKVRYIGEDKIIYEPGHLYEVMGYDEELGLYAIMSEADVAFLLADTLYEEIDTTEKEAGV